MLNIEIANEQEALVVDEQQLVRAIQLVAQQADITQGEISLAIITDPEMHQLNRRHLNHDYPTDVLSFVFEREAGHLEGEIIVSADTAITSARQVAWPAEHELLLYVVHGMLHLVGYDDKEPADRQAMRAAEQRTMQQLGITMQEGDGVE